jgi:hypothetical protein
MVRKQIIKFQEAIVVLFGSKIYLMPEATMIETNICFILSRYSLPHTRAQFVTASPVAEYCLPNFSPIFLQHGNFCL